MTLYIRSRTDVRQQFFSLSLEFPLHFEISPDAVHRRRQSIVDVKSNGNQESARHNHQKIRYHIILIVCDNNMWCSLNTMSRVLIYVNKISSTSRRQKCLKTLLYKSNTMWTPHLSNDYARWSVKSRNLFSGRAIV